MRTRAETDLMDFDEDRPPHDPVEAPMHYQGNVQCIEALESTLTVEEFEGFCKGSAMQYIWRERRKNGTEDIAKAVWYLNRLMEYRDDRL